MEAIWKKGRRGEERERKGRMRGVQCNTLKTENKRASKNQAGIASSEQRTNKGSAPQHTSRVANCKLPHNPPTKDVKRAQQHIRVSHGQSPQSHARRQQNLIDERRQMRRATHLCQPPRKNAPIACPERKRRRKERGHGAPPRRQWGREPNRRR